MPHVLHIRQNASRGMSCSAAKTLACRSLREFRAVPSGPYHPAGVFKAMAQDNRTDLVGNGGHISVRRGSARQGDHPFLKKPLQLFPVRCAAKNKALLLEDAGKGRHGGDVVTKKALPQFPGLVVPRTDCSHAHIPEDSAFLIIGQRFAPAIRNALFDPSPGHQGRPGYPVWRPAC